MTYKLSSFIASLSLLWDFLDGQLQREPPQDRARLVKNLRAGGDYAVTALKEIVLFPRGTRICQRLAKAIITELAGPAQLRQLAVQRRAANRIIRLLAKQR